MNAHRILAGLALLAATGAAQADPFAEILAARNQFIDNAPIQVDPPEPRDLESFLLSQSPSITLALINQVEGSGNRAEIEQQGGVQNIVAVFQGFGDDNQARIGQTGNGNFALLTQSGSQNQVTLLDQLGNDNIARMLQEGSGNLAQVNQYNDRNILTLQQLDGYNNALVNQYGDTDLTITQTNPGGSGASVNELSVAAHVEPGYTSNFGPIVLDGAGQTAMTLCSGSAAYCAQY
ncbi:hypothetical protein [Solimonas sp. K1W22B-7]|uniref:hypothetical protein n=1 Tax=Solimonas sp. K1W22B-7 TaxID=2303331 RepID=UPI0013C3FC16|nr:hypothetical protein [Solimonas sp. K1W22B-7]